MIQLGSKVRDTVSGFTGIASGRSEFMYGCARILIEPDKLDKDGKTMEAGWFDEQRVEVIQELKPKVSKASAATSGGPQKDATRGR